MTAELSTQAWRRLAHAVIDRDLGLCQIRGPGCTRYATEADHIVARIDGGAMFDPANLRASCKRCNAKAGARVGNARRARYRVSVVDYVTRF